MATDYTTLSLDDIAAELVAIAGDAQSVFGRLDERQINWRPDATRWSVAQCFDHLLTANAQMFRAIDAAMDASAPRSLWQRLPWVPGLLGTMLVRSQSPQATRKFTAPAQAQPAASAIDGAIVARFVACQHEAGDRVRALAGRDVAHTVMVSPFASFITYSVLDGWRIIAAHQRRHFEQARRVTGSPGFPAA